LEATIVSSTPTVAREIHFTTQPSLVSTGCTIVLGGRLGYPDDSVFLSLAFW
jgi:hypothetical protein